MTAVPESVGDLEGFPSVLILKPSSLGDVVHTLPAVQMLRHAMPHARFRWLANTEWMPLLEGSGIVDEVLEFPRRKFRGLAGAGCALNWILKWNRARRDWPELVLDFQGLLRSGLLAWTRGSTPVIGLSDAREGASRFYDKVVQVDPGAHAVDRYVSIVRALGLAMNGVKPVFPLPSGEPVDDVARLDKSFIVLHPWSRGEGKSLSGEVLQTLCDCLAPRTVVLAGITGAPDRPLGAHLLDVSNRTSLPQLIWLMRRASFCVSVDSGPMHIASAVNDRVLGIHTWSDPRKVGPYSPSAWVWKAGRIDRRMEFSDAECRQDVQVTASDARRMADFIHRQLAGD